MQSRGKQRVSKANKMNQNQRRIYQSLLLLQLNARSMINTHIYHLLPPTRFGCLLRHLQRDNCNTCSRTVCFVQCCYIGRATKCKIFPVFLKFTVLLQCLKQYVFRKYYVLNVETALSI
jgi:hypothetical protein